MRYSYDASEASYKDAFLQYTVPSNYLLGSLEQVDHLLLSWLTNSPEKYKCQLPIEKSTKDSLLGVLWFKLCGGSRQLFDKISPAANKFSESQEISGIACGGLFKNGDGIYRCR